MDSLIKAWKSLEKMICMAKESPNANLVEELLDLSAQSPLYHPADPPIQPLIQDLLGCIQKENDRIRKPQSSTHFRPTGGALIGEVLTLSQASRLINLYCPLHSITIVFMNLELTGPS